MLWYRVVHTMGTCSSGRDNVGVATSNATNIVWAGRTECTTSLYRSRICRALKYPLCALLLAHCACCCLRLQGALIYRKCEPNRSDLFICINTLLTGQVTLFYFKCILPYLSSEQESCNFKHKQWAIWMCLLTTMQTLWANCATARISAFVVWLLQAPILFTGKV